MVNGQNERINGDFEYLINGSALDLPGIHRSVSRGHTLFCVLFRTIYSLALFSQEIGEIHTTNCNILDPNKT